MYYIYCIFQWYCCIVHDVFYHQEMSTCFLHSSYNYDYIEIEVTLRMGFARYKSYSKNVLIDYCRGY